MNGIGGNTIEEAKRNISYLEAQTWLAYIQKYGTLNIARRIENQTGILGHISSNGKIQFEEIAPFEARQQMTQIEDAIQSFGAVVRSREEIKKIQLERKLKRDKKRLRNGK